jgi:hypothetical protein
METMEWVATQTYSISAHTLRCGIHCGKPHRYTYKSKNWSIVLMECKIGPICKVGVKSELYMS